MHTPSATNSTSSSRSLPLRIAATSWSQSAKPGFGVLGAVGFTPEQLEIELVDR